VGKSGPVSRSSDFKAIPVLDGNGDQLVLYEFRDKTFFGLVVRRRYELGTGEPLKKVGNGFVVTTTGEKLTRVRDNS
jgi:hypothetical protein